MKDLTKGNEIKHILLFTIPLFIGNVFQQLYNMVDAIVVGKFLGSDALTAVGTSSPVLFLIISFAMGLAIGGSVVISQYFGAKRLEELKKSVSTLLIFMFAFSVVLTVIGFIISRPILVLLQTPKASLNDAILYLNIMFAGLTLMFVYNVFGGIMRGLGDSWSPLIFLVIASVLNIFLDILFVGPLGFGVGGAAWATVISQGVSSVLCVVYVYKRIPLLRYHKHEFVFDKDEFRKIFSFGINTGTQQTILAVGNILVQGLVNHFGTVTAAAFTAAIRMDQIAFMPIMNIGMAVTNFTGQNVGAGKFDRVKKGLRGSIAAVLIMTVIAAGILITFGGSFISLFLNSNDKYYSDIIVQGKDYLSTVSLFYWVIGIMFAVNGVLRGAGDMLIPTVSTTLSLAARVIFAYALAPVFNYKAIWYAIPLGWCIAVVIPSLRYLNGKWKEKAIVRVDNPDSLIKTAN